MHAKKSTLSASRATEALAQLVTSSVLMKRRTFKKFSRMTLSRSSQELVIFIKSRHYDLPPTSNPSYWMLSLYCIAIGSQVLENSQLSQLVAFQAPGKFVAMAQRVLVLGAGGQLGRKLCERFALRGWDTMGADLNQKGQERGRQEVGKRMKQGTSFLAIDFVICGC